MISQPPNTLAGSFSAFNRWEMELETTGKPGMVSRAFVFARMTAAELVAAY